LINTVGAPGIQGVVAGMHGPDPVGFRQAGLVGELQIPKLAMFSIGMQSAIVAAGVIAVTMAPSGTTMSGIGTFPKMHCIMAPATTN
jgi:hypothetical protein